MQQPVVVYQMGKVGSTSMAEALTAVGLPVFQVHTLNATLLARIVKRHQDQGLRLPGHIRESLKIKEEFLDKGRPIKVITAVRDPIARNISAYFQMLNSFRPLKLEFEENELQAMMTEFLKKYRHDLPLTWFDIEIKEVLGVDVYNHPFPKNDGVQRIQENGQDILLFKAETTDSIKVAAIKEFLQISQLSLGLKNVGEEKAYTHYYKPFRDRIQLPAAYLDKMYESSLARHFYTPEEILKFRQRWTRNLLNSGQEEVSRSVA